MRIFPQRCCLLAECHGGSDYYSGLSDHLADGRRPACGLHHEFARWPVKANAAIVPAGYQGAVSVYVTDTTNVILDIDGYFAPPGSGTYQFYPLTPCRLVDTRGADGNSEARACRRKRRAAFPLLESSCIPAGLNPLAYSLNFTVVPNPSGSAAGLSDGLAHGRDAAGGLDPQQSHGNGCGQRRDCACGNRTAHRRLRLQHHRSANRHQWLLRGAGNGRIVDVSGCALPRAGHAPTTTASRSAARETVNVVGSVCAPPSNAAAYIFNATVVPPGSMGYLTLWPDGEQQPVVSTLNAYDGFITSNMAIVPTNNGSIDAYA
jgi:hypothetical protein